MSNLFKASEFNQPTQVQHISDSDSDRKIVQQAELVEQQLECPEEPPEKKTKGKAVVGKKHLQKNSTKKSASTEKTLPTSASSKSILITLKMFILERCCRIPESWCDVMNDQYLQVMGERTDEQKSLDCQEEEQIPIMNILNILTEWMTALSPSHGSLQDYVRSLQDNTWLSLSINVETRRALLKFFIRCRDNYRETAPHTGIEEKCSSAVQSTGNQATGAVPAEGFVQSASSDFLLEEPSTSTGWTRRSYASASHITYSEGKNCYISRFQGNRGKFVMKTELYLASDVEHLQTNEWWRYANHRSNIRFNEATEVSAKAKDWTNYLETMWATRDGRPLYPEVSLELRDQPTPPHKTGQPTDGCVHGYRKEDNQNR